MCLYIAVIFLTTINNNNNNASYKINAEIKMKQKSTQETTLQSKQKNNNVE